MQLGGSVRRVKYASSLTSASRFDAFSLGVSGADSRQAVIIEIGKKLTKVGYAGEFAPRAIIYSEVPDEMFVAKKLYSPDYSQNEQYHMLIKFFRIIFFKYLLTVAKDRRIVIVESLLEPVRHKDLIARVLFEVFDAPSVLFAPSHLLATFPFGCSNALVIDVGYSESVVIPVIEGVVALNNHELSSISSRLLEEKAEELLFKYGKVLTCSGEERPLVETDKVILAKHLIIEDIICRFCFVTTMERGHQIQSSGYSIDGDIPKPPCEVRLTFGAEQIVVPGILREWIPEAMFELEDEKSIANMVLDCIYRCPVDCRRTLIKSIILVGGPTCLKGFYARLKSEITRLLTTSKYENRLNNLGSVMFYMLPNSSIEIYANWLGGSMFGSLEVLQYRSLSREDWFAKKYVPDWSISEHKKEVDPAKMR